MISPSLKNEIMYCGGIGLTAASDACILSGNSWEWGSMHFGYSFLLAHGPEAAGDHSSPWLSVTWNSGSWLLALDWPSPGSHVHLGIKQKIEKSLCFSPCLCCSAFPMHKRKFINLKINKTIYSIQWPGNLVCYSWHLT